VEGKSPYFVFDGHCDTALRLVGEEAVDLGKRLEDGHLDIPRMGEGGVGAQVFACWSDPDLHPDRWKPDTLSVIEAVRNQAAKYPNSMEIALCGTDITRIAASGRIAAVIGLEGGHVLGRDISQISELFEAGIRCLTLTWMNSNELADSADGERSWSGLSAIGRNLVKEMNRLGIVIDLSHASDETVFETIESSTAPVLVSHSCMRALCDIPRNVGDDILKALRASGGMVCINFFPAFLEKECHEVVFEVWNRYRAHRSELAEKYGGDPARADREIADRYFKELETIPLPGLEAVADHIEHAASVAGPEHVGIGSDFDGIKLTPPGLEDVSRMQALAQELHRRGWTEEDIKAVMGGNLLRLFTEVCG
jgi:membrane dipeptidase